MRLNKAKIQAKMLKKGWDNNKLAEEMDVTRQYVSYYLMPTTNASFKVIYKFAKALECEPKEIVNFKNEED